ncbi:GerMN domain-containing protein [Geobacter argillaceus]|uniref:Sporulation and spore germination protein n=1 Tax=Geobacter argillaceus TaxID=345631 RepID=A0A562VPI1_9BACT|nr:GerMN domain-containing protein [Geobacter argillaceus]TWJ19748.1 sporulation and spore germination protein [Geobacter argillaceus]
MFRKFSLLLLVLVAALAVALTSCKKKAEQPATVQARVAATKAYEKYFGTAPTSDKGSCYAFVIYFPSAKEPGKVVPFPFFTFDESSMKKVAVERLLSGMDLGSYQGEFISFSSGSRLIAITDDQGTVTANFSKELENSDSAVARAIDLTLRQFQGVKTVRLLVEGKESNLSAVAKNSDDTAVLQPSPPRLLSVTAMRDKGAKDVEEVNAFFDRPVDVKELVMMSKDGQKFAGDLYHSVFDMAAVLKPKEPSMFKERLPIKVRWKVVDKLGRQAEGDNVWFLEVKQHEQ